MEQKDVIVGVTKGTPLEKQVGIIADAEVRGTKQYYALARAARSKGLPEEIADKLEEMADQESNHGGFYALLNAEAPVDVFAAMRQATKPEYNQALSCSLLPTNCAPWGLRRLHKPLRPSSRKSIITVRCWMSC